MADFTKNITYSSYNALNPYGYGSGTADYKWHGWGAGKVNNQYGFAGLRTNGTIHYAFAYRFRTPTWSGTVKKISIAFALNRETSAAATVNVSLTSSDPSLNTNYGNSSLPSDPGRIANTTVSCNPGDNVYTVEFNISSLAQGATYYLVISPNGGTTNYATISTIALAGTVTYEASASEVSASNGYIGSAIPISITNDGMSHALSYSFAGHTGTIGTTTGSSFTWNVPASFNGYIPQSLSGTCTIYCDTEAGRTSTRITLYVPDTIKPTISSRAIAVVNENTTVAGWGIYLQNYSKIRATLSAAASYSTIKSWRIECGPVTFSGDESTASISIDETSEILTTAGTYKVTATVTDARGRTATAVEFATFTVQPYTSPTAVNVQMYRCRQDGTKDETEGTYLYCKATRSYSAVGGNTCTMRFQYKERSDVSYTSVSIQDNVGIVTGGGNIDVLKAYNMRIEISDSLNTTYYNGIVPTQSIPFNLKPSSKSGAGFGMYAQEDETVELAPSWSLKVSALAKIRIGDTTLADALGSMVYPVGAYFWTSTNYASAAAVRAALGFGTWEKIEGKFLYAADSQHAGGTTGGAETITLAENQMPSHRHTVGRHNHTVDIGHGHSASLSMNAVGDHSHNVSSNGHGGVPRGFMIRDTGTVSGTGSGQAQSVSSGMGFSVAPNISSDNAGGHTPSGSVSVNNYTGTKETSYVPEQEGYVTATSYVPASGTQQEINKMPPYQAAYCWHRTA